MKSVRISRFNLVFAISQGLLTTSFLLVSTPINALTLITEREELGANDNLNFGSLRRVFNPTDPNSFLASSFSATSENGLDLNFTIPPSGNAAISPPFIFQTGFPPNGVPTNFAEGDFILFSGADFRSFPAPGNSNPLTIDFATPVTAAGTQIAVDDTLSFTANIAAFDSEGNLLDSFSVLGTSGTALDNSALFLGVADEFASISRLVYSSSVPNRAIGINDISIEGNNNTNSIPEPSTIFALGMLAVCGTSLKFLNSSKL